MTRDSRPSPSGPRLLRVHRRLAAPLSNQDGGSLHLADSPDDAASVERAGNQIWWREVDSNHRRRKPADLQSAPVGRLGIPPLENA